MVLLLRLFTSSSSPTFSPSCSSSFCYPPPPGLSKLLSRWSSGMARHLGRGEPLGEGGANKLWQSSGYHTQHTLAQEPTPPQANIVMQILSLENRALSFKYCPRATTEDHNNKAKHTYNLYIAPIKSQNRDVCNRAANCLKMELCKSF